MTTVRIRQWRYKKLNGRRLHILTRNCETKKRCFLDILFLVEIFYVYFQDTGIPFRFHSNKSIRNVILSRSNLSIGSFASPAGVTAILLMIWSCISHNLRISSLDAGILLEWTLVIIKPLFQFFSYSDTIVV